MNNGRIAKITLEVTVYKDRVVGVASSTKWTSEHSGHSIKTTPWTAHYGHGIGASLAIPKSLKQAILEVTEPQIDFSMEDLGLVANDEADDDMNAAFPEQAFIPR